MNVQDRIIALEREVQRLRQLIPRRIQLAGSGGGGGTVAIATIVSRSTPNVTATIAGYESPVPVTAIGIRDGENLFEGDQFLAVYVAGTWYIDVPRWLGGD